MRPPEIRPPRRARTAAVTAGSLLLVLLLASCGPLTSRLAAGASPSGPMASPSGPGTSPSAPGQPVPVGSSSHTISIGGLSRTYLLYRPASLPAAAPLVVMLHGGFGSGQQAENSYGWNAEADRGHFVVAYPNGLNRAWNTGG